MVTLVGATLALCAALYVTGAVCSREYRIRLRWPAFAGLGLLLGTALALVLASGPLGSLPVLRLGYAYPGLAFLLLVLLAWPVGYLLRPWKHSFYEALD